MESGGDKINSSEVTIKNNIIANCSYGIFDDDGDILENPVLDYNCYHSNSIQDTWDENDTGVITKGVNAVSADPKFVDAVNDDFHLQSDSPCIEKGTNVGIKQDFYGTYIPQGLCPDIGAVEYIVRQDPTEYSSGFSF